MGSTKKFIIAAGLAACLLTGCRTGKTPSAPTAAPDNPAPVIAEAAGSVQAASAVINESAHKIRTAAGTISARVPDEVAQAQARSITAEADKIEAQTVPLTRAVAELKTSAPVVEKIEQAATDNLAIIEAKDKEIAELKERNNGLLGKILPVFILAGTLLLAVSVYLFIVGNPKAMSGGLAGGTLIIVSMAVTVLTKLTTLFVVLAGLGVIAIVATLGYHGWMYIRQCNGLQQVVQSVELIKQELPEDAKARMFGAGKTVGAVSTVQDAATQALVRELRGKAATNAAGH